MYRDLSLSSVAGPAARTGYRTRVLRVAPRQAPFPGNGYAGDRSRFDSSSRPRLVDTGAFDLVAGTGSTPCRAPSTAAPPAGDTRWGHPRQHSEKKPTVVTNTKEVAP